MKVLFNNSRAVLICILLILASFSSIAKSVTQAQAKAATEEAHNLWQQSIAAGHEWSTIKPLVVQSKKNLTAKLYFSALSLAEQAISQSKQALIQAEHEKINWLNNLPK
ncbi:MAG: hypothetical protein A6F72_03425 [Cycloclasticus sp. symbiont of Poecilosclerida sp. N]|nr:MAG: hypothetical protein A6F72_03425 [Cycloclasticus sp. symbiont of Poecilosclerida sp. N]